MAKDICAATGERIRKLRRARNWRQIDLAEHSGVHEVHISDLERGTREPGLRTLSKIVTALWLFPLLIVHGWRLRLLTAF
jgi:transcriptional regulator with XRE-family HTH domain